MKCISRISMHKHFYQFTDMDKIKTITVWITDFLLKRLLKITILDLKMEIQDTEWYV